MHCHRRAQVAAVVAVILTLISLGVTFVLPGTDPRFWWLHTALTAWLSFSVLFNYAAAVSKDPGRFSSNLHWVCRLTWPQLSCAWWQYRMQPFLPITASVCTAEQQGSFICLPQGLSGAG